MKKTKTFLVVLGSDYDRDQVTKVFEETDGLEYWFYNLPYSVFVNSTLTGPEIGQIIRDKFDSKDRFFVTQVQDYYGLLPGDHWNNFKDAQIED